MSAIIRKERSGDSVGRRFVLSDETKDRLGDVIRVGGWDLTNFLKNPVALFGHDSKFIIGNWTNIGVEGKQLVGTLEPAKKGTSERVDEINSLVDQGLLKATSVGFREMKSQPLDKERPFAGTEFLKQELVEASLVAIPANPNALMFAKQMNVSEETRNIIFRDNPPAVDVPDWFTFDPKTDVVTLFGRKCTVDFLRAVFQDKSIPFGDADAIVRHVALQSERNPYHEGWRWARDVLAREQMSLLRK